MTTKVVAAALGVSERSVRMYAQSGRIPFRLTPGGHRRFDLDEVRAALAIDRARVAPTMALLRLHRTGILESARRHGAHDLRVFGSVATGTADEESDIDILVTLDGGRSYADVEDLETELATLLGHSVDVLTEGACHGRFAPVLDEAIPL